MDYETALRIYQELEATKCRATRDDLFRRAVRYAGLRAEWFLIPREERIERSALRRNAHDAFIDACNILSRAMSNEGEYTGWRDLLGTDRKRIGDFACHLHCILGLAAR